MSEINARESFEVLTNSGMNLSRKMKLKATKLQDQLVAKKPKVENVSDAEMAKIPWIFHKAVASLKRK